MTGIETFLAATVRSALPLAFAALGELVVERAGILNIGLEGIILAGALGAVVGAGHGLAAGYISGVMAGVMLASIFALCVVWRRTDQIITGTAITMLGVGATGSLYRVLFGASGAALSIPTSRPFQVPWLSELPLVGPALFAQPPVTYLLFMLAPALAWWLYSTHAGLALRAIGEAPAAAEAAGVPVRRTQALAVVFGGACGGLAGAVLVLAQAGTFAENMSAGRGFIAIAIVVLGGWRPLGVALAALAFGAATATQFVFQARGWVVPYQLFLALPYLVTLAALASAAGRTRAPAALGR